MPRLSIICCLALLAGALAANKDDWRPRSIYQLITDRFAPPSPGKECDIRSYCGGTWRTTIEKLDYLQELGFDAIWISPTGLGLEGYTKWGEGYHGYWPVDPFGINPHFGTSADLHALSDALHARGMYLMVDVAVSALASTTTDITDSALAVKSGGQLLFQHQADYTKPCKIQFGNRWSEENCWLAQDGVALMHLRTGEARVADVLKEKFTAYIKEYKIDGVRIDATRLMTKKFQYELCTEAGTFCMGEVHDPGTAFPASWTKGNGIDSVLGFGMMWGAVDVWGHNKPMSALSTRAKEAASSYADPTIIGAFIDNHDLPRFNSITTDKSNVANAMSLMFLFGGIPTMYYGLEQEITFGSHDPDNRAPLWQHSNYAQDGLGFQRVKRLNLVRKRMGELGGFHEVVGKQVGVTAGEIAFVRKGSLLVLTNRGAGKGGDWTIAQAGFAANAKVVDLLSCSTATAGKDGSLKVTFVDGLPFFYVTADVAGKTGICGEIPESSSISSSSFTASPSSTTTSTTSASTSISTSIASITASVPQTTSLPLTNSTSTGPSSLSTGAVLATTSVIISPISVTILGGPLSFTPLITFTTIISPSGTAPSTATGTPVSPSASILGPAINAPSKPVLDASKSTLLSTIPTTTTGNFNSSPTPIIDSSGNTAPSQSQPASDSSDPNVSPATNNPSSDPSLDRPTLQHASTPLTDDSAPQRGPADFGSGSNPIGEGLPGNLEDGPAPTSPSGEASGTSDSPSTSGPGGDVGQAGNAGAGDSGSQAEALAIPPNSQGTGTPIPGQSTPGPDTSAIPSGAGEPVVGSGSGVGAGPIGSGPARNNGSSTETGTEGTTTRPTSTGTPPPGQSSGANRLVDSFRFSLALGSFLLVGLFSI